MIDDPCVSSEKGTGPPNGGKIRERKLSDEEGRRPDQGAPGNVGDIGTFLTLVCFDVAYFRNRIR